MKANVGVVSKTAIAQLREELQEIKDTSEQLIELFTEVKETISNLHTRVDDDMQAVEDIYSETSNIEKTEYE